jgi:serine/threonine-protein kinase
VVKLTDFGIARARDATPLTRTGMVVGTAQYLSPEQAQGFEVTAASDVYSLGVVGYECLTGGRPFDGTSQVAVALAHINRQPPPLPANVPPAVRLLIERALAKDPAARFPDGAAFAAAIRSVASGNGTSAHRAAGPATTPPYPMGAAPTAQTEVVDDLADSRTQVLGAASAGGAAVTGARTSVGAMPPLRRTEDDDEGGRHTAPPPDDDRRRKPWVWLVAGLLLLALVGGGLWALSGSGDDGSTGTDATPTTAAPSSASSAAPGTFFVATDDYVGDNVEDVADLLRAAGLQVETDEASAAQLAALGQPLDEGDVVTTDPANTDVSPGDTVTLFYAAADFAPDTGDEDTGTGEDEAPAVPTTQAPPRTTAAPAPTTANAPRPSSSAPATSSSAPATSSSAAASSSEAEGSVVQEPELPAEPAPDRPDQRGDGRPQAEAQSQQQAVQGAGPTG